MAPFSLPRISSKAATPVGWRARVVTEGVVSETVFRQPDPRLHGIVAGAYQGWREVSSEVVRRREVPACEIPFIINFGATFGLIDPARPGAATRRLGTFVAGVHDSYVIVESSGDSCCIQVNFTLPGARQFFQVPLGELSNRSVELDELFGDQSARMVETLAAIGDWDRRLDLLEAWILTRVGSARPLRNETQQAWMMMQETGGRLEIGALAGELGWSHKHMISQFRDQLGAPPKRIGRILRLQRAIQRITANPAPGWVELAVDCGYSDQSHLIREFRQIAGCTPEEFVRLQLPFGGVSADDDSGSGRFSRR